MKAATIFVLMGLALFAMAEDKKTKAKSVELEFTVKPTKSSFRENEPIEVRFGIRNLSSTKVVVAKTFQLTQFVDLEIVDEQGRRAAWCGRISGQIESRRPYGVLNANESFFAKVAISCVHKEKPAEAWGYSFGQPGRYVIRAVYRLPEPLAIYKKMFPDIPIVRGPIPATAITIEIK